MWAPCACTSSGPARSGTTSLFGYNELVRTDRGYNELGYNELVRTDRGYNEHHGSGTTSRFGQIEGCQGERLLYHRGGGAANSVRWSRTSYSSRWSRSGTSYSSRWSRSGTSYSSRWSGTSYSSRWSGTSYSSRNTAGRATALATQQEDERELTGSTTSCARSSRGKGVGEDEQQLSQGSNKTSGTSRLRKPTPEEQLEWLRERERNSFRERERSGSESESTRQRKITGEDTPRAFSTAGHVIPR